LAEWIDPSFPGVGYKRNPCGPLIVDVRGSRLGLVVVWRIIMESEITNEQKTDCGAVRVITESAISGDFKKLVHLWLRYINGRATDMKKKTVR
jgi:hypothetical protein